MALKLLRKAGVFIRAGLIAPAAGGVWSGLAFATLMAFAGEAYRSPTVFFELVAMTSLYSALIALILTWTLGLAWHAIACALNWRNVASYVTAGAGVGAVLGAAIALAAISAAAGDNPRSASTISVLMLMGWFGSTGGFVSGVGWLIRRPDRDEPNPGTAAP